jgi:hypothetical protein
LPEGKRIVTARVVNPFQMPEIQELKSSMLDLRVVDEKENSIKS